MRRFVIPIAILLITAACQTAGRLADGAAGGTAMLIALEAAAEPGLPRDDSVGRRVLNEISDRSAARGFRVFDGTILTRDTAASGSARRPAADWIDLARGHRRPPIDTVMLMSVTMEIRRLPHARKLRVRVAGRTLDVASGRWLGTAEAKGRRNVDPGCVGACVEEAAGDLARDLAREVGDALTDRLAAHISGRPSADAPLVDAPEARRGYTLVFDDFDIVEMRDIEAYLSLFRGYRRHRPVTRYYRHAEIWYESAIAEVRLRQNLEEMFAELGMKAHIAHDGSVYRIRQLRLPLRANRRAKAYKW